MNLGLLGESSVAEGSAAERKAGDPCSESNDKRLLKILDYVKRKKQMWIRYGGGTHGSQPRRVFPIKTINDHQFLAVCFMDDPPRTKTFNIDKISEIRDERWVPDSDKMDQQVSLCFYY